MNQIKFCIFSDYHYWKGNYPNAIEPLNEIIEAAHCKKVDFIIQCGDLCHNAPTAPELDVYLHNQYGIPVFNCLGNHELEDAASLEAVCKTYGMKKNYEAHDINGFRLIILDTNYFLSNDGTIKHQRPMTYGGDGPSGYLGDKQLEWLENQILTSSNPCIVFSHDSMESNICSPDATRFRNIIRAANRKKRGSVLLCCNGHYHTNAVSVIEDVVYFDVNATFNIFWNPNPIQLFPKSFCSTARMAAQCCYAKDPLYAIVTLEADGHIVIEGVKSEYLFGISPESVNFDSAANHRGRGADPNILSADISLR